MIADRKYYDSPFHPFEWESALHTTLRVQVAQVRKNKSRGMGMVPYESTAAALILLLDKAAAQAQERMGQMEAMVSAMEVATEEMKDAAERIVALEKEKSGLEATLAAKEQENANISGRLQAMQQEAKEAKAVSEAKPAAKKTSGTTAKK